jgi:hypothetical protein
MLDGNIDRVVELVSPYVTDSIWLGKMNHLKTRLSLNGIKDQETMIRAEELMETQSDDRIWGIYDRYKDNPQIKWKESIKMVVGLEIPVEKGLDV